MNSTRGTGVGWVRTASARLVGRMKSLHSQNFYEILGVSRYASPEELRHAYELSRQTFTQDSMATYSLFSEEEHEEILDLIGTAYETLLNARSRQEYDTFLDSGETDSPNAWSAWRRPPAERKRSGPVIHSGLSWRLWVRFWEIV